MSEGVWLEEYWYWRKKTASEGVYLYLIYRYEPSIIAQGNILYDVMSV